MTKLYRTICPIHTNYGVIFKGTVFALDDVECGYDVGGKYYDIGDDIRLYEEDLEPQELW